MLKFEYLKMERDSLWMVLWRESETSVNMPLYTGRLWEAQLLVSIFSKDMDALRRQVLHGRVSGIDRETTRD